MPPERLYHEGSWPARPPQTSELELRAPLPWYLAPEKSEEVVRQASVRVTCFPDGSRVEEHYGADADDDEIDETYA